MAEEIMKGFFRINLTIPRGGFESFLDAWLISSNGVNILFETGPACSIDGLLADLQKLGITHINYLVFTHIHLDHAGGLGQLAAAHPETKILVPKGAAQHLIDPSALAEKSVTALGNLCSIYGRPIPVDAANFIDNIPNVEIIPTPGHAPFHNSYVVNHNGHKILFVGEAAGCSFRLADGSFFMRPASPHKFYYDTAMSSLLKIMAVDNVDLYCFPHSGSVSAPSDVLQRAYAQMQLWYDSLKNIGDLDDVDKAVQLIKANDPVMEKLSVLPENVRKREEFFIRQSAKGYLGWIKRVRN